MPDRFRKVPAMKVHFRPEEIAKAHVALDASLGTGRLILGPYTAEFETLFAEYVGLPHAISLNTCTSALEVILRHLGVAGRDVLVPDNTNFATARAVLGAGARPVLYDSGLYPSAREISAAISATTSAVLVVHVGGYLAPELPAIESMLSRHGIPLVEDAAHAHGSRLGGTPAGAFGRAGAFSFFPTKVVTTIEGGMIVTSDADLNVAARSMRDQGKDEAGEFHIRVGSSWRMSEVGAALGSAQMATLDADANRRTAIIRSYATALEGSEITFPAIHPEDVVSGHKALALVADGAFRDEMRRRALTRGVQLGRGVYEHPLHVHPVFESLGRGRSYPIAAEFADRHISLPLWRDMSDDDVEHVIEVLHEVSGGSRT